MSAIPEFNNIYGFTSPISAQTLAPIVAKRNPLTNDFYPIGQQWVNRVTSTVFFLASIANNEANWIQMANSSSGTFNSITVNPGPATFVSDLDMTGNFNLTGDITSVGINSITGITAINLAGAAGTSISGGTNTGTVTIGNSATTAVELGCPLTTVAALTDIVASPTATAVINSNVGYVTFTGFTTAAAATQVFTITNSTAALGAQILVTVDNEGANDAQMTITRVQMGAGTFNVTVKNNGSAALNGNININFWILN